MALELLLLLACAPPPDGPQGRVEGRTWYAPGTGVAVDFPAGWSIVVDPALFVAELPGTLLEGRREETLLALGHFPTPAARWVPEATAMDLLAWRLPLGEAELASYQRLSQCHEAIEQVLVGEDGRPLTRIALSGPSGLTLFQAWSPSGAPDGEAIRQLVCDATRVRR